MVERALRNTTGLGLLCLLLLFGAAPGAAADGFAAITYPVTMSGQQLGSGPVFGTEAGNATCESTTLTSPSLSGDAASLTLTPAFSKCKAFGFASATVTTTGCTFSLQGPSETATIESFEGTMNLSCEAGKSIVIVAVSCEIQVPGQTGLNTIKYVNHTEKSPQNFDATFALTGIKYNVVKDGFLCPFAGTGEKSGGTFSDEVTIKASNEAGEQDALVRPPTELCTQAPTGTPLKCNGKVFTTKDLSGTLINLAATWLDSNGFTITCGSSTMALKLRSVGWGGGGEGITAWTFATKGGACTSDYAGAPAVIVTMENLSYDGTTAQFRISGPSQGRLGVGKRLGSIQVKIEIGNGGPTCLYQPPAVIAARWVNGTGATPSSIEFFNQQFGKTGGPGNCPTSMILDATYSIVQPAGAGNVYIATT